MTSKAYQPAVIATWNFGRIAVEPCIEMLCSGRSSIDAVVHGISEVETDTKDQYFVGVGGLPNADGVMELDAAIMDHNRRYGAVMGIQDIAHPIQVARTVMENCPHNVLVGDGALKWALEQGFERCPEVLTEKSKQEWLLWKKSQSEEENGHDTIGLICLDQYGHLCVGTSTSGWKFKHPGRVGDSPLVGSGLYCDGEVGAAAATGDGEEIMRVCLSFLVVENMRNGKSPQEACQLAIQRLQSLSDKGKASQHLAKFHSKLTVGVIAMDIHGNMGSASTICDQNPHRDNPFFPSVVWRFNNNDNQPRLLESSVNGAQF